MFRGSMGVLATHSIRQFPLHFPSRASPCTITFQLESTTYRWCERARAFARWSICLPILREVTVKINTFNPMKHEVYINSTLKFGSDITENTDFQLQGLADYVQWNNHETSCGRNVLFLLLIWLAQVGSEEAETASCLVTSTPDGGERSDSHWILFGPIPIHEESL
jgi:hypothetical protein